MKTPDLVRPKGKKGIYYANTHYEGYKLNDCLHTNDEVLAYRRLCQIYNDIDEGRYQIGKKLLIGVWNNTRKTLNHI